MTAMGVAGSLNLNDLLRAQSSVPETKFSSAAARYAHLSDGERHELLGPVKMCIEESSAVVTTREYGPDRKLVASHSEYQGKSFNDSSGYSEVRDPQGRMLKYSSRNREGAIQETTYDYDTDGRLLSISNDQNCDRTEYHYRADGSNTSIQTFDPKTIEQNQNAVCAGSEWDGTTIGGGVPIGGNVTTTYDKNDNPIELQVQNAEGELVTHIVRTYDSEGRLAEERLLEKNMPTSFLKWMSAEQQAELTPAQRKAYSKGSYALIKNPLETTYTYDAAGKELSATDANGESARTAVKM